MSSRALAPDAAVMPMESAITVVRFGTPAAELAQASGFERARLDPAAEPWATLKRRSEVRLRWDRPEARAALLDLEVADPAPYAALRVLLNGHRVARLDLAPGRRRLAFDLPADRQQAGANVIGLVFGAPRDGGDAPPAAARAFGLAVGPPSPAMAALARAPLPFSAWAEGNDLVQAGPGALAYAVDAPEGLRLRFTPASRPEGAAAGFRIEARSSAGATRELWSGGAGREMVVEVPADPAGPQLIRFEVATADGAPAWGAWRGLSVLAAPGPPPAAEPPALAAARRGLAAANVVVVVLDAAGARHFGCYGRQRRTTPQIDRIAAEGVVFERAYTPAVFTRSAMASVWTSQLPDEHHGSVSYDEKLPASVPTLAEAVARAGIATAAFVGNNMAGSAFGLDRGFAEFFRVSHRGELFRDFLAGWLARNKERRFLAYVHFREPHFPFDPRPPYDTAFGPDAPLPRSAKTDSRWMERVNEGAAAATPAEIDHLQRLYEGNLASVDEEIGHLRRALEAQGLWDRTVLVVTADHGEALHEHGFIGHNEQLYEESVHVPLVIRFPKGTVAGGRRVAGLASLLDVAPTVADALGIAPPPSFRGRSLLPAAAGAAAAAREPVLCRTVGTLARYAWVGPRYKYQYDTRDGEDEMHDLQRDPQEREDLVGRDPARAAYLRQQLFARLLALPGRSGASAKGWTVPPEQLENLRALGYVQ